MLNGDGQIGRFVYQLGHNSEKWPRKNFLRSNWRRYYRLFNEPESGSESSDDASDHSTVETILT